MAPSPDTEPTELHDLKHEDFHDDDDDDGEEDVGLLDDDDPHPHPHPQYQRPPPRTRRTHLILAAVLLLVLAIAAFSFYRDPNSPTAAPSEHAPDVDPPLSDLDAVSSIDTSAPCQRVPSPMIARLEESSERAVTVLAGDRVLTPDQPLQLPSTLCILISIPQEPLPDLDPDYVDPPVPNKGPDSIHLLINSTDVTLTFPPLRPLHPNPVDTPPSIIYYAEATILQGGTYEIHAEQEFANWKWAMGWHLAYGAQPFRLETGQLPDKTFEAHEFRPVALPRAQFTVQGPSQFPQLPVCTFKNIPDKGRWYRKDAFPELESVPADETGYIWQGDHCLLDYFAPTDTASCLENKNIHVYGDSMTRRLTKMLINSGEWCYNLTNKCQDEDERPGIFLTKMEEDDLGALTWTPINQDSTMFDHENITTIPFAKNATIQYQFIETITNVTSKYMVRFFDPADLIHIPTPVPDMVPDYDPRPAAIPRMSPALRAPDAVLVGFGAWDQAFTDHPDPYETNVARFRAILAQAYAPATPILLRTANAFCCRSTGTGFRRYTGGRTQEFDDRTRKVFGITGAGGLTADGRFRVVDVTNMNGRPDIIFRWGRSDANHPRASHARIEMQMVLHSLCARDRDGVVRWSGAEA